MHAIRPSRSHLGPVWKDRPGGMEPRGQVLTSRHHFYLTNDRQLVRSGDRTRCGGFMLLLLLFRKIHTVRSLPTLKSTPIPQALYKLALQPII